MLAAFDPATSKVIEAKRDSMCSLVSVGSLNFLNSPESSFLNDLDFDDDVSTDPASTESSPVKDKAMNLEIEDENGMPSRKRRASRFNEPAFRTGDELLASLGDSSGSLFQGGNFLPSSLENELLALANFGEEHEQQEIPMEVEQRSRSQSSERRRIQSELLARLECLDGIQLPEATAENELELENDGQPRPEQPEPRLGKYNEKQRVDRLNAYREKRKQRVYGRVRYVLRQRVSEARPRVKGRFVKQTTDQNSASPDSVRDHESSTTASPSASSNGSIPPTRKVEFRVESNDSSPAAKRGRSAWEMFKNLTLFSPISKSEKFKRPSLPASFSERLLLSRRKSTTAASTASGKARRRFSRDEFFDEDDIKTIPEPDRKRATSMKKWDH